MTYVDYLSVVRRRWLYLVVGLVAGALSGYLTAPSGSEDQARFQATHTLIVDSAAPSGPTTNLDQAALLVSTGPVPDRVVARLQAEGLRAPETIVATPDTTLLSLSITAVASEAEVATAAADLTAEEVVAEFVAADVRAHDAEVAEANEEVEAAEEQRAELFAGLAVLPEGHPDRSTLAEEIAGLSAEIPTLRAKARNVAEQGPPEPPLRTLEAAEASQVDEDGWSLPADPLERALLLALIGLGLGLVGAFVAEQVDSRIGAPRTPRTRSTSRWSPRFPASRGAASAADAWSPSTSPPRRSSRPTGRCEPWCCSPPASTNGRSTGRTAPRRHAPG